MSRNNKGRLAVIVIVVAVALFAFRLMRGKDTSLLDHARRISDAGPSARDADPYFWLNASELLYLRPMQQAGSYVVMRRNIESGQESEQGNLPHSGLIMSPDGLWALTYKATNPGFLFSLQRTDGKAGGSYRSPTNDGPLNVAWLPDDAGLVELTLANTGAQTSSTGDIPSRKTQSGTLRIYSLDKAAPITALPTDENSPNLTLLGVLPNNHALIVDNFENFIHSNSQRVRDKVQMIDFPLVKDEVGHHYTVSKPTDALDLETALSPQGDRVAWMYAFLHTPPGFHNLTRLYAALHVSQSYSVGLWLSKPDGSDLHPIGSLDVKNEANIPTGLRWMPDGKNLSFLYKDSLYILPAK